VSAATQVAYAALDADFFKLPTDVQQRIQAKIDEMGLNLGTFPHYRMTGVNRYRLRAGDYRVIYAAAIDANVIHLLAVRHRRDLYR
jgi:mRNA interferase RelE/StbE